MNSPWYTSLLQKLIGSSLKHFRCKSLNLLLLWDRFCAIGFKNASNLYLRFTYQYLNTLFKGTIVLTYFDRWAHWKFRCWQLEIFPYTHFNKWLNVFNIGREIFQKAKKQFILFCPQISIDVFLTDTILYHCKISITSFQSTGAGDDTRCFTLHRKEYLFFSTQRFLRQIEKSRHRCLLEPIDWQVCNPVGPLGKRGWVFGEQTTVARLLLRVLPPRLRWNWKT